MNPLIIIDIDEEEPHYDLLNGTQFENCHFILNNRWPVNHSWVYVNESGLHTTAIDREHQSIAFMPVSQVQVEVILVCEGDLARNKRSLTSDALGPYDYGSNKWILTDTIIFNSRKSFVNIIVNDINDNAPIFIGKENEPLAVGYPVPELAERVLPRALAELRVRFFKKVVMWPMISVKFYCSLYNANDSIGSGIGLKQTCRTNLD